MFVAGFIGSPPMNLFDGRIEEHDGQAKVRVAENLIALDGSENRALLGGSRRSGTRVIVGIRPEKFEETAPIARGGERRLVGDVVLREALGSDVLVHFAVPGRTQLSRD